MSRLACTLMGCLLLISFDASAQTVGDDLRAAALIDSRNVDALVAANRLDVKPAAQALTDEFVRTRLDGDEAAAAGLLDAVNRLASSFESTFGERSIRIATEPLSGWNTEQLAAKLRADSLLAAAVAIRREDREAAKVDLEAALADYVAIGDASGKAEVLGQLGYVAFFLDRPRYVDQNLAALEARRAADDQQLIGNTLNDLGLGYRLAGDGETALAYYQQGERVRESIGDSLRLGTMLPNIGLTLESMGDYAGARDYYLKAGELKLALGDSAGWIGQRSNAAGLMTDYAGRHSEALAILLGLEADMRRIDEPHTRAVVLITMGIVNRRLGDYAGAVENYREAIRLCDANGFDDLLGRALNNIAVVYIFLSRPARAIPYLERAMSALPPEDVEGRTDVLLSLGSASFALGNYEDAEDYTELAREQAKDRTRQARVIKLAADTKVRSGRAEEAIGEYESLLAIADELEVPDLRMDAYFGLGEAAERSGDPVAALDYYEEATLSLEMARGLLRAEEDKAGYLALTRYLYEEIIHFLTEQAVANPDAEYAATAFRMAERGKSRAFLDQMAEALAGVEEGVDPEFRSDLNILAGNMTHLRQELAAADPTTEREKISELKGLVAQMESEYDRVEREMRERNPRFAAMQYPDPIGAVELQSSVLQEGEVLLQYALGDSSSTLWVVTPTDLQIHRLPTRPEIEAQVDLLRFALQNQTAPDPSAFASPARRLFETLVGPAADVAMSARELIVVRDGALNYLPFEALLTADSGDTFGDLPYLVRSVPVSYVMSASVLRQLRAEPPVEPTHELLAVGDPAFDSIDAVGPLRGAGLQRLPFSGSEVTAIASLMDAESSDVFTDTTATKDRIKRALSSNRYRFVHFATHGLVNDDRPDFSALALAGSGSDGLLEAGEIFNMRIDADLVVLSACETGLGQLVKGEGVVGLTRAFMYAGAPSVVVSLWSVSDQSTSALMQGLYGGLVGEGQDKASALKSAKMELIEDTDTAHPFHWAPFVLVGRSR